MKRVCIMEKQTYIYEAPSAEVVDAEIERRICSFTQQSYNYGNLDEED